MDTVTPTSDFAGSMFVHINDCFYRIK